MAYKRKYERGERIKTLDEFSRCDFVWVRGKVYHNGWAQSWQCRDVLCLIRTGDLYKAEKIKEESEVKNNEKSNDR